MAWRREIRTGYMVFVSNGQVGGSTSFHLGNRSRHELELACKEEVHPDRLQQRRR